MILQGCGFAFTCGAQLVQILQALHGLGLKRVAANWVRLFVLVLSVKPACSFDVGVSVICRPVDFHLSHFELSGTFSLFSLRSVTALVPPFQWWLVVSVVILPSAWTLAGLCLLLDLPETSLSVVVSCSERLCRWSVVPWPS